jgi:hypothetical protein
MQRSSQSIASLAAALAKAQAELINPEKSLVATIRSEAGGTEQTFRYAPLSSGLDIVRKILGQHEIATLQTTSIDQPAGAVDLTTVLAHSSGEWIASDWPVCSISDTTAPHRMGAALTYARRYALFTLVGIAGEDDLDAPDLNAPTAPAAGAEKPAAKKLGGLNCCREHATQRVRGGGGAKAASGRPKLSLNADASAALRDQLVAELKNLNSADEAANWAHRVLGAKNSLATADAACIEQAFQATLSTFATTNESPIARQEEQQLTHRGKKRRRSAAIDKTALALPAPRRVRDRDHVKSVAKQPCLVCGRRPADAHHLRFAQLPALGRKVSDEFTVPLCRGHHREVHHCGDEAIWWGKTGINPTTVARALWLKSHPLPMTRLNAQPRSDPPREASNSQNEPNLEVGPHDLVPADRGQPP